MDFENLLNGYREYKRQKISFARLNPYDQNKDSMTFNAEANSPRLFDIVSILDRIPGNIVCDLPFPAFLSHHTSEAFPLLRHGDRKSLPSHISAQSSKQHTPNPPTRAPNHNLGPLSKDAEDPHCECRNGVDYIDHSLLHDLLKPTRRKDRDIIRF